MMAPLEKYRGEAIDRFLTSTAQASLPAAATAGSSGLDGPRRDKIPPAKLAGKTDVFGEES